MKDDHLFKSASLFNLGMSSEKPVERNLVESISMQRLACLRAHMAAKHIDAYIVRDTINIRWLCDFDAVFDDERAHTLWVSAQRAVLHTDSRYSLACTQAAHAAGDAVLVDDQVISQAAFPAQMAQTDGLIPAKDALICTESSLTVAEYRALCQALEVNQVTVEDGTILNLRSIKNEAEIQRHCRAQEITDKAFEYIVSYIREHAEATERQVALELEYTMLRLGAEALSFPAIVASGARAASPHAIPTDAVLEAGPVVIDFGCMVDGYCSDMTRTICIGQPSSQVARGYAALAAANEAVEEALRPGIVGSEMQKLAESILAEHGFAGAMGHGLGHGVGLEIHEQPNLNTRNDKPLPVGAVVTVEPGIYLGPQSPLLEQGQTPFGMRLEDFGVITVSGFRKFTQTDHSVVIIERA